MKEIKLKSIALTNFRGHKSTTIDQFSDLTTISGDNGTGKSTIFDAFLWLLFGKDQFDRKDFEIIPTVNAQMLEKVDSTVQAQILFDGRLLTLTRTLHQNWVRPRGQSEEVYKGNETLYQWDGVDIKAGDYKARIDLMVEETIFKLITRPEAFLNLHWTKMREFLFQMSGTISDAEIAASNPNFFTLLEMVNGKKLAEFKTEIRAKKKKAKEELETVQPRIDQTTKLMPANRDFAAIEAEIKRIDNEIIVLDEQIQDRSKAIRGQYEAVQQKQKDINDLKTKQLQVVNTKTQQNQQDAFKANQQRTELQNEFNTVKQNLKSAESDMETAKNGIDTLRKLKESKINEVEKLREDWEAENASEYKAKDGCLVCPVFQHECSDSTAASKHVEAQQKAKASFLAAKNTKLDNLDNQGAKLNEEITAIEVRISNGQSIYDAAKLKAEELNAKYNEIGHKLGETKEATPEAVIASELPEWQELDKQIKAIEATIDDVKPVDNTELNTKKAELNSKRDGLKNDLTARETIARYTKEIKELNSRASELAQQIADLEGQEFTIDAFNKVKIEECDRRINGMFSQVRFKLFDYTNDGNEFETCIPTNLNGVPYAVTNTADQINMGLDCITAISKFYNVLAPVFLDRAESINAPNVTGSQMILVKVTANGTPFQVTNH